MTSRSNETVEMIPIEQINVVNPRSRGQAKFRQIIDNIAKIGLKRPITLARRATQSGSFLYDLVCGQGRLEACRANGSKVVPAIVLEVTRLLFVVSALKSIFQDEGFVTLLRAESLDSLPQYIAEQIKGEHS